jgi:hypothetical protein
MGVDKDLVAKARATAESIVAAYKMALHKTEFRATSSLGPATEGGFVRFEIIFAGRSEVRVSGETTWVHHASRVDRLSPVAHVVIRVGHASSLYPIYLQDMGRLNNDGTYHLDAERVRDTIERVTQFM